METLFDELRERLLRAGVMRRHVRRYLAELTDHLADLKAEEIQAGRSSTEAEVAAIARLGTVDDLASAMIAKRQFQSWCVRAPLAAFGVVPLLSLALAYFIAVCILRSGWHLFLPEADTPFIPLTSTEGGLAILYFGIGRWLYELAPLLIAWGTGIVAARQRLKSAWPLLGLALIAWMGGTAHIHASRTAVPAGFGHISMKFFSGGLAAPLLIFAIGALPYLVWRVRYFAVGE